MRVYLAGPLFTQAEQDFNRKVRDFLVAQGHSVFVPQDEVVVPEVNQAIDVRQQCIRGLDSCEIVVAILDGPDVDSGTAFECGYAYAKGKKIFGLRTDFRRVSDTNSIDVNAMFSVCEVISSKIMELLDAINKL